MSNDQSDGDLSSYTQVFSTITAKQHQVFAMVAEHRTSKEIAGALNITESAVNQRIEVVRSRMGYPPRARLARAYRHYQLMADRDEPPAPMGAEPDPPQQLAYPAAWQRHASEWILPAALVGPNAGFNRSVAMVVIAAGLLVVALTGLGVAKTLESMIHPSTEQARAQIAEDTVAADASAAESMAEARVSAGTAGL